MKVILAVLHFYRLYNVYEKSWASHSYAFPKTYEYVVNNVSWKIDHDAPIDLTEELTTAKEQLHAFYKESATRLHLNQLSTARYEAEIIQLKDLVQAKNLVIDKLTAEANS